MTSPLSAKLFGSREKTEWTRALAVMAGFYAASFAAFTVFVWETNPIAGYISWALTGMH